MSSALLDAIADGARAESDVWASALVDAPRFEPVFGPLVPPGLALGIETVYEAYLVHYGRPRIFSPLDDGEAVLLGDYLYAHGLVRVAEAGGVDAVAALADLVTTCAALRADNAPGDGEAWLRVTRELGGDPSGDDVASALARHSARVGA